MQRLPAETSMTTVVYVSETRGAVVTIGATLGLLLNPCSNAPAMKVTSIQSQDLCLLLPGILQ
jgi:hypothetical protein